MKKLIILLSIIAVSTSALAIQNISIRRLGGFNTRTNPMELQDGEATDMSNFVLDEAGSITERGLFKKYNSTSIGSRITDYIFKFYKSSDEGYMLCASGTRLYKAVSGALTPIFITNNTVTKDAVQWGFESFTGDSTERVFGASNDFTLCSWDGVTSNFRTEHANISPATNCNILKKHKSRLWASGSANFPYRIYYSSLGNGLNWTTSGGSMDLPTYEKIMALEELGDILYIFTRQGVYAVIGDTPNEFYIQKTSSRVGTHAYKSVAIGGNLIYFLNKSGVFVFDGNDATNISETIQPTIDGISSTYISSSAGLYDKRGRYWLSFTSTSGSFNDTIIVYDTVLKQWYKVDGINLSSFFKLEGANDKGEIYAGASNPIGYIWQLQSTSAVEQITHSTQTQLASGVTFNTVINEDPNVEMLNGDDQYTKLLVHANGIDGATTYTSDDYATRTLTFNNGAQIDTAQAKFQWEKYNAASLLFDGVNDCITIPDSDDWNFDTGDFTIDFNVRFNALPGAGNTAIFVNRSPAGGGIGVAGDWSLYLYNNAGTYEIRFGYFDGGGQTYVATWNPSVNTWYHVLFTRSSGSIKAFVDGNQVGTTGACTTDIVDRALTINLGGDAGGGPNTILNGWLDEVRVSKGISRHFASFTPYWKEYHLVRACGTLTSANIEINAAGQASLGAITWNESLPSNTDIQFTTRTGATDDTVYYNGWGTWVSTSTVVITNNSANMWLTLSDPINFSRSAPMTPQTRNILFYESSDSISAPCVSFNVVGMASKNDYADALIPNVDLSGYKYIGFWLKSPCSGDSVKLTIGDVTSSTIGYITANTVDLNTWEYHYWPLANYTSTDIDDISKIRITYLGDAKGEVYLGEVDAFDFLDSTDTITSTPNDFIQYRAILGTTSARHNPQLISNNNYVLTISYTSSSGSEETSLTSTWKSKIFDCGNRYKKLFQWVEFFLESENPTTGHTVYMDYWLDDKAKTQLSKTVNITGSTTQVRFYLPSGSYGTTFQYEFEDNDIDDNIKIKQANISYIQEGGI